MRIIVLTRTHGADRIISSFSPDIEFIVTNNIIFLHNNIVKYDFDGVLLDCSIRCVWTMNLSAHLKKAQRSFPCYYFNPDSVSESHMQIFAITDSLKHSATIVTPKTFCRLFSEKPHMNKTEPFIHTKLSYHQKKLFSYFCMHEGKLISVKDMSEHVFGTYNERHKKTLYAYIHTIRSCIEDNPSVPKHLIRKEKGLYTYI